MALREIAASFGVEVDDSKLDALQSKIKSTIESLKGFGAAVAAGAIVKGVVEFANHTAEMVDHIEDSAIALGISTEAFQALSLTAKAAGDDVGEIVPALARLAVHARDAGKAADGSAGKAFAKLGVSVKDASGQLKASDVLLQDVADGIAKIQNPTERTAAAVDLFGKSGYKMLPFLTGARGDMRELAAEAKRLGGGFNAAAIAAGGNFQKATAKLGFSLTSLQARIATALLPILSRMADAMTNVVARLVELVDHSSIVQAGLVVLGVALAALGVIALTALAPVLIALAPIVLGFAALFLIVEDLITLFRGGDSVIGRVLDKLFGVGTAQRFVEDMTAAWELFKVAVVGVGEAMGAVRFLITGVVGFVEKLVGRISQLAEALDKLTGGRTKKTEGGTSAAIFEATKAGLAAKGQSIDTLQSIASLAPAAAGGQSLAPAAAGGQSAVGVSQSVSAPAAAGARNVSISSPVNITIEGGASPETADAIGRRVREEMAAMTREAGEILVTEAP